MLSVKGVQVLRGIESSIRALVKEAAADGDYENVMRLARLASEVASVIGESAGRSPEPCESTLPAISTNRRQQKRIDPAGRAQSGRKKVARHKKARYPRFERIKDDLMKIGWSKKDRSEYQHRSPGRVVQLLVSRVCEVSKANQLFTTEDLFPLVDTNGDTEIPSYQAYLCLAWLRQEGLVVSEGRLGYRVPGSLDLRLEADKRWRGLSGPQ